MKNLIFLILFTFLVGCKTSSPTISKNINPAVQTKLEQLVQSNNLTGLSFSIIYPNQKQENYVSGFSNVEEKIPLNTNHVFFSGSIGKTYAAALLFQLIDDKKVDLSQKYKTYFPNLEWLSKVPNINDFTVGMLLEHTSGLPRYVLGNEIWEALHNDPDKVWTYKERMSYIFEKAPVHEAGKGWAYSDTNYILIGMLVEKILEAYYYDIVKSKILKPKKLKNTHPLDKRTIPNLAIGYSQLPASFQIPNKTVTNGKYVFNPQLEWTGGGMSSTAGDLAHWAKIYFEGELFSKALLEKMTTINPNGNKVMGENSYGMGSFIYSLKSGKAYGHTGFMPGYNSIFAYLPEKKIAIALQSNCDYAGQKMKLTGYLEELIPLVTK